MRRAFIVGLLILTLIAPIRGEEGEEGGESSGGAEHHSETVP